DAVGGRHRGGLAQAGGGRVGGQEHVGEEVVGEVAGVAGAGVAGAGVAGGELGGQFPQGGGLRVDVLPGGPVERVRDHGRGVPLGNGGGPGQPLRGPARQLVQRARCPVHGAASELLGLHHARVHTEGLGEHAGTDGALPAGDPVDGGGGTAGGRRLPPQLLQPLARGGEPAVGVGD